MVTEHRFGACRGVYGPFIELFKCMDQMNAAVEVTAGNQLFQVVVDTDETATIIVQHLNRTKGGRVTFMPLNRLQVAATAECCVIQHLKTCTICCSAF